MSSALVLIRPDSFSLYYSDRPGSIGGAINPSSVKDMDVVSEAELIKAIAKFVPGNARTPVSSVFAIADELCFALPRKSEKLEEIEKRLVELTPFTQVALASVKAGNESYVVATNQDLYESYGRAFTTVHHPVVLTIPWMALLQAGITRGEMDSITVKRVFDSLTTLRGASFPTRIEGVQASVATGEKITQKNRKPIWGWIIFGAVALLYALIMYWFFIRA